MKDKKTLIWQLNPINAPANKIDTAHLQLRQPTVDDFGILRELWRDVKVRQFLGGIISIEEIEKKIVTIKDHWEQHGFGEFAVNEKNANEIVGLCGLHHSEDGIEISYMFFPAYWGKGIATEAMLASLNYGFNLLNLESIIAITQEANHASCRLLEKTGMRYISTVRRFDEQQRIYKLTNIGNKYE